MLQSYVESAQSKLDALQDISHISFALHHQFEQEVEDERECARAAEGGYC
jgi:hypothetical protein